MAPDYSGLTAHSHGAFAVLRRRSARAFELAFAEGEIAGRQLRASDHLQPLLSEFIAGMEPRAIVAAYRALLRAAARRRAEDVTFARQDASGGPRWHRLSILARRCAGETQWSLQLQDVTDLKQAEKLAADHAVEFDTLFRNAPENIIRYDTEGRILDYNASLERLFGIPPHVARGQKTSAVLGEQSFAPIREAMETTLRTGERQDVDYPMETPGGKMEYHLVSFVPERDSTGAVTGVLGFGRNVGDLQRIQNALAESQDLLRAAVKIFPDMVWLKDKNGRYILCNDRFEAFNGVKQGALLGKTADDTAEGIKSQVHTDTDVQALQTRDMLQFCLRVTLPADARPHFFDVRKTAVRNRQDEIVGILGTARDITEKLKLEEEIRTRERAYRTLAEHLPDCLTRYDSLGRRIYTNRSMEDVFREFFTANESGEMIPAFPHPDASGDYQPVSQRALDVIRTRQTVTFELTLCNRDGRAFAYEIRLVPEFDADGKVENVLGIGRDITEQKEAERRLRVKERELEALAYSDSLTGLSNRVAFRAELKERLKKVCSQGGKLALLTLDIDRFKSVNDTLGHLRGDELLIEFSRRLRDTVGSRALIARLGGDEFVVVLSFVAGRAGALAVADALAKNISPPVVIGGAPIHISTSIGIAVAPDDSATEEELFRFSDIALYSAKMSGRSKAVCFSKDLREKAERRFELEAMMNDALEQSQFFTHFQPKFDLATGKLDGAEALCRWRHPIMGLISPADFIPVAEETGQIIELGKRVLLDACRVAVACNARRAEPFRIAVNISARQLLFGGFLGAFGSCLDKTGCKAQWIELEITESLLLADDNAISDTLATITSLGASLTIDDFGTGYSSLSYLGRLPISTLKIDQSFVRGMEFERKQEILVRAIIAMAQGLGLKTVAEGVETREIADRLRGFGCDSGQGFLWRRAEPASELLRMLADERAAADLRREPIRHKRRSRSRS